MSIKNEVRRPSGEHNDAFQQVADDAAQGKVHTIDTDTGTGTDTGTDTGPAGAAPARANLFQRDSVDIRRTETTLSSEQIKTKLAALDSKMQGRAEWPRIKGHLERLLSTAGPTDQHNAGVIIAQLTRSVYNDPELQKTQGNAFAALQTLNNEVFGNTIKLETNFLDNTLTSDELTAVTAYQREHPQLFPYATETFDRSANVAAATACIDCEDPAKLEGLQKNYYSAFLAWAQREGIDTGTAEGLTEAKEKWVDDGIFSESPAATEVNLMEKRQIGWVGLRRVHTELKQKLGHEPSAKEIVEHLKEKGSTFSLTAESDAILSELSKYVSMQAAERITGDLTAEDKVRFSMDNPWTWLSILLAVLSAVMLFMPGGQPIAIACGAAALGITGFEFFVDKKSGHLGDDTAAHRRMLQEPDFNAQQLYRAFDPRATSNAGVVSGTQDILGEAAATPQGNANWAEKERPVVETEFGPVSIESAAQQAEGGFAAKGHDTTGREVNVFLTPSVEFDSSAKLESETLVQEIATDLGDGELADYEGRVITVDGGTGRNVAARVESVQHEVTQRQIDGRAESEHHLVITAKTPDGRTVTISRSAGDAAALVADASEGPTTKTVAELTEDPAQRRMLASWFGFRGADPAAWEITPQGYAEFLGKAQNGLLTVAGKQVGIEDLQKVSPGIETLALLEASFGEHVNADATKLLYAGDAQWQDTSNLDMVTQKRPNKPEEAVTSVVNLRPGAGTVSVGVVGVDYDGSTSAVQWRAPNGNGYALEIVISKGKDPTLRTLEITRGGKTETVTLSAPLNDEHNALLREHDINFTPRRHSDTTMAFSLDVQSDGAVTTALIGARGGKNKDVDDFYATIHGAPPANPIAAKREVNIAGEARYGVSATRADLGDDGDIRIRNRRITHWVALGSKLLLMAGAIAANANAGGGSGGNGGGGGDTPTTGTGPGGVDGVTNAPITPVGGPPGGIDGITNIPGLGT